MLPVLSSASPGLPEPLKAILLEIENSPPVPDNLAFLDQIHTAFVAEAQACLPALQVESGGETLYLGDLSPGCRACKSGTWDCIFLTSRCNLACGFCYNPQSLSSPAGSVFGNSPEEIAANHACTRITGVSFSGGEPFLEPAFLHSWLSWFRKHRPEQYTWVYTNGLLAHPGILAALGSLGLDEIRFDTAASNYTHPTVMENIAAAARCIPGITVEIPAIPAHASRLLDSLRLWSDLGVRFLNLHELIYEPGTLSADYPGSRQPVILPDGHRTFIDPHSQALILDVMEKVTAEGLPLSVNDCSLHSKFLQIRGRRRSLAPLSREPYEKLIGDETLTCCLAYASGDDYRFFHPDRISDMRSIYPTGRFVRLQRRAPLELNGKKQWIACENC